jgi:hypothetical protein
MNPHSKRITLHICKDLFEESVRIQEERRKRAEEVRQWRELSEMAPVTLHPTHKRVSWRRKVSVAGIDEFLDRMEKRRNNIRKTRDSEIDYYAVSPYLGAILERPFSFQQRTRKPSRSLVTEVDAILSQVNEVVYGGD